MKKEIDKLIKRLADKSTSEANFLSDLFLLFQTRKEMTSLLYSLLTKPERKAIATRMLIIKMLKDDVPQHKISEKLRTGVLTVTRGAAEIQKGRFEFM